jgi:AcrR family transcriptional regulator
MFVCQRTVFVMAPEWPHSHPRGRLHQNGRRHGGSRGRARGRERHLSRDAILDAALAIVDREGVDAVTMRRVAEELGTGAASLYAHIQDKDELLAAVYDWMMGQEFPPAVTPDPKRWEEQTKELMRAWRRALMKHNDIAKVQLGNVPTGPNAVRSMEQMFAVLHAGGLPPRVIGYAGDLLAQFMSVSAYEVALFNARMKTPEEWEAFHRDLVAFFEELPAAQFPTLKLLAPNLVEDDEDEDTRFEFGLDILIRGLAAHAPSSRRRTAK